MNIVLEFILSELFWFAVGVVVVYYFGGPIRKWWCRISGRSCESMDDLRHGNFYLRSIRELNAKEIRRLKSELATAKNSEPDRITGLMLHRKGKMPDNTSECRSDCYCFDPYGKIKEKKVRKQIEKARKGKYELQLHAVNEVYQSDLLLSIPPEWTKNETAVMEILKECQKQVRSDNKVLSKQ